MPRISPTAPSHKAKTPRPGKKAPTSRGAQRARLTTKPSSGNVFADLGLDNSEELMQRAKLTSRLRRLIEARGLTQKQAGELLGIDQPKVSHLMRGKLGGLSIERLLRMLNAMGQNVRIMIQPAPSGEPGSTQVIAMG